jgi:hypothetical protein
MNTKLKQDQKNQRQKTRQGQRTAKRGQNSQMLPDRKPHDQEHPETRLTR